MQMFFGEVFHNICIREMGKFTEYHKELEADRFWTRNERQWDDEEYYHARKGRRRKEQRKT